MDPLRRPPILLHLHPCTAVYCRCMQPSAALSACCCAPPVHLQVRMWEMITWAMAGLGSAAAAATEEDLQELQSAGSAAAAGEAGSSSGTAAAEGGGGSATDGAWSGDSEEEAEELVEYEGMLVSAAAAQRRRWACALRVLCGFWSAGWDAGELFKAQRHAGARCGRPVV